jgi:hypothetical protein
LREEGDLLPPDEIGIDRILHESLVETGFLFPFRGMPWWAQILGEILPITHFLRIV